MTSSNVLTTVVFALLFTTSVAQYDKIRKDFDKLQAGKHKVAPIAHNYQQDCWNDAVLHIKPSATALLQHHNVPGAGIEKFKPFQKVLKDGFLLVDCVRDYMYERGDKFGDNKHDYKLGPVSNVSIVHYDAFVAKEDQVEMTQKVCFEFCRTVPNMIYFGITNGRGCYCTPYFKAMASDSSQCDAHCEGDATTACGGKSKSSIFAMHMCDSTKEDLGKKVGEAATNSYETLKLVQVAKGLSNKMQNMAAKLQKSFGAVGDSGATSLMQEAKVFAGELLHKAEDAEASANSLGDLAKSARSLRDFTSSDTVTKAERIMEGIAEEWDTGSVVHDQLVTLEAYAKGEMRPMDIMVSHASAASHGASFLESQTGNSFNHNSSVDFEKVGKDGWYNPGPWFMLCDTLRKSADCSVEACSGLAVAAEECAGYFETFTRREDAKVTSWNARYADRQLCFCRTAAEFDESKQMRYNSRWWMVKTYKYKLPEKKAGALAQYYPVMYFVDKKYEEMPTTCDGDLVSKPIVGQSAEVCAASCDMQIHSCVAFQFFEDGKDTMCFMFSKFSTGFYYTGCGKSFLQSSKAPFTAKCYAKLSKFVGTTLKPNPSGKCDQCFKDLTGANRCYK